MPHYYSFNQGKYVIIKNEETSSSQKEVVIEPAVEGRCEDETLDNGLSVKRCTKSKPAVTEIVTTKNKNISYEIFDYDNNLYVLMNNCNDDGTICESEQTGELDENGNVKIL